MRSTRFVLVDLTIHHSATVRHSGILSPASPDLAAPCPFSGSTNLNAAGIQIKSAEGFEMERDSVCSRFHTGAV